MSHSAVGLTIVKRDGDALISIAMKGKTARRQIVILASLLIVVLLVLALVGLGVNRYCINKTYTVKVSSDHPIGFYGHYTWHTAFGNSPLKQLSDTSPTQYTVNGIDVSVYFVVPEYPSSQTMRGNFGDIEVEIIRGGVILAKSKTTTTNRIISINAH